MREFFYYLKMCIVVKASLYLIIISCVLCRFALRLQLEFVENAIEG